MRKDHGELHERKIPWTGVQRVGELRVTYCVVELRVKGSCAVRDLSSNPDVICSCVTLVTWPL